MQTPVAIPAPTDEDEPFQVGDSLTVYEAAMVYAGRYPYPQMFGPYDDEGSKRAHCLTLLKLGLAGRRRQRVRRSWDVFCQIKGEIERGQIKPIKSAHDLDGKIDPFRTVIRTSDLVLLATHRGEQPRSLKPLQTVVTTSDQERAVTAYAADIFKQKPDSKHDDVLAACRDRFGKVSERTFRYRICPHAREAADLPRYARPGPKPEPRKRR
jgi:hypothetical protein